jgi:hypothetical protein
MARTSQIKRSVQSQPSVALAPPTLEKPILLDYPGLGLPLRYNDQENYGFYPIGAHGSCYGADSDLLPVRELAMMSIMDRLTDKPDWEKKVFDEEIVAKWKTEAMQVDDAIWWKLAKSEKRQQWDANGKLTVTDDWATKRTEATKGFINEGTFDCVSVLSLRHQV